MKFFVLRTCLLLVSVCPVAAQTLGTRLGINFASQQWVYAGEKYNTKSDPGVNLGINLNLAEIHPLSTQLEFAYSQFGFTHGEKSYNINYVKLGCAIKGNLHKTFNLHFGPEIGFQVSEKQKFLASGDFGIFGGAEVYPNPRFGVGARYYWGVSDLSETDVKQFNRAFQFYLCLRFKSAQLEELGY